jgi:hypothetical protein
VAGFESFAFQCTGDDIAEQFVRKLDELQSELIKEYTITIPMKISPTDEKARADADVCCESKKAFGTCTNKLKVRHHDHKTGDYKTRDRHVPHGL